MVEESTLSSVLSDFARTMVTDFPIQRILDSLVERIVAILPITAAGVTMITKGQPPRFIAASDSSALRFERLQTTIGDGPCVLAYESGASVAVADLATETRFPDFARPALEAGLVAVFTFPLRHGNGPALGALDLYRQTAGPLSETDMVAAQTLADVAAAYLWNAISREKTEQMAVRSHHSSLHDALTGLPNRLLLAERLERAAQRARRTHRSAAVLFVDLDRFKQVNDHYGHHTGDQLLIAVAGRLSAILRPGDTLCRVSGDEFVFLCEDLESAHDAEGIATRITEQLVEPFDVLDLSLVVTASVGLAYAGPGTEVSDQLVVDADTAMYQAKRRGGDGHRVIDLREALRHNRRNELETDLRTAIADGALSVAYQPIVRTADGTVTGVEALLRWTHARYGEISPVVAVDIAEQSPLINEIGQWVLEQAGRDRAQWLRDAPERPLHLAVNVSGRQLLSNGFCVLVDDMLTSTGMSPEALILELTENVLIDDTERTLNVLGDLRSLGVRLALDDFGTGFSSLSYLARLPIDILKIDRAFVADIDGNPGNAAIVTAVADLARAFKLEVIAEGVETPVQHDRIAALGCESSQGFYYSWPVTAAALGEQLATTRTHPLRLPVQRGHHGSLTPSS